MLTKKTVKKSKIRTMRWGLSTERSRRFSTPTFSTADSHFWRVEKMLLTLRVTWIKGNSITDTSYQIFKINFTQGRLLSEIWSRCQVKAGSELNSLRTRWQSLIQKLQRGFFRNLSYKICQETVGRENQGQLWNTQPQACNLLTITITLQWVEDPRNFLETNRARSVLGRLTQPHSSKSTIIKNRFSSSQSFLRSCSWKTVINRLKWILIGCKGRVSAQDKLLILLKTSLISWISPQRPTSEAGCHRSWRTPQLSEMSNRRVKFWKKLNSTLS